MSLFFYSFHQVIVEIPGKVTKRQTSILPDNVTNYEEARRRGDKFYMAASLSRDALSTSKVFVLGDGKTYEGYENVRLEPGTRYKAYIRGVTEDNGVRKPRMWVEVKSFLMQEVFCWCLILNIFVFLFFFFALTEIFVWIANWNKLTTHWWYVPWGCSS